MQAQLKALETEAAAARDDRKRAMADAHKCRAEAAAARGADGPLWGWGRGWAE